MAPSGPEALLNEALALIDSVPEYADAAAHLRSLRARGRLRIESISDRGRATFNGIVALGPEAFAGGVVGLAETLIHERFHLAQFPLDKTKSFWSGVFTKTPVWRRLERPAYQEARTFLEALAKARPELAADARAEVRALEAAFQIHYGEALD